jgi:long-chain acyl-CoA synthetase
MDGASEYATLPGMVKASAGRFTQQVALIDPVRESEYTTFTYGDLWGNILKVATQLTLRGILPGDRVGLLANGRSWWPTCDIGIIATGAWTVPIYSSLPANQVQFIIAHSEMRGIIVENESQLAKVLEPSESGLSGLEFIVLLEGEPSEFDKQRSDWPIYSYSEWLNAVCDEQVIENRMSRIDPEDVASIVYTSGTTGLPKGVLLTHRNFLSNVKSISQVVRLSTSDIALSYLPLSHIFERTAGQFFTLSQGGTIAYSRGFSSIQEDLKYREPTIITTVPRLLEKVYERILVEVDKAGSIQKYLFKTAVREGKRVRVRKEKNAGLMLSIFDKLVFQKIKNVFGKRLQLVVVGGAPMPPEVGEFFTAAGIVVLEGYGMTETSPVIAVNRLGDVQFGTVGRPVDNVSTLIAEDGELLVKGPNISQGYYKNDLATKELFTANGWLRTGDIAEFVENKYLKITDRKKNLLVLSTGKKVAPAPIESDILGSPFIDQILLIGQGRKYVSAIVVPAAEPVENWLKEHGKPAVRQPFVDNESVYELLMREVAKKVGSYATFERPKKLLIVGEAFSVDNGLLTPTLKIRAKAVLAAYTAEIDALYENQPEQLIQEISH